jgi:hypothetical protein
MTAAEFCFWLQGVFEVADVKALDERQTDLVRKHLALAFLHDIDQRPSVEEQAKLNKVHTGRPERPGEVLLRC